VPLERCLAAVDRLTLCDVADIGSPVGWSATSWSLWEDVWTHQHGWRLYRQNTSDSTKILRRQVCCAQLHLHLLVCA